MRENYLYVSRASIISIPVPTLIDIGIAERVMGKLRQAAARRERSLTAHG
jgi:hypothetical protein